MAALGYPGYFVTILGMWKVLGGLAILAPRLARLKEWAYAGIAFDLTGAAFSHAAMGDPVAKVIVPLVLLGFAAASSALRRDGRAVVGEDRGSRDGEDGSLTSPGGGRVSASPAGEVAVFVHRSHSLVAFRHSSDETLPDVTCQDT
jgi:hypothetical protein